MPLHADRKRAVYTSNTSWCLVEMEEGMGNEREKTRWIRIKKEGRKGRV